MLTKADTKNEYLIEKCNKIAAQSAVDCMRYSAAYKALAADCKESTAKINASRSMFARNIRNAKNAMQDALKDMGKKEGACLIQGIAEEDIAAFALIGSIKSGNKYGQKIALAAMAACAGNGRGNL